MSNSSDMDFAEVSAAYEAGEFKKAFDIFLRLATENDDPSAMSMVATMYGDGAGVPSILSWLNGGVERQLSKESHLP